MAACSKEETKKICDCNVPKPNKVSILSQITTSSQGNIEISVVRLTNRPIIVCNQTHFKRLLQQTVIGKDSIIRVEAYSSGDCDNNSNSALIFTFLDVVSVKKDTIK